MGYLYLALALAGGVAKGLCGKGISREMRTFRDCLFINAMRMLFCLLLSFLTVMIGGGCRNLAVSGQTAGICAVSAVGMSVFCVCWMYAYRTEAYIFLNIFTMLGTVITCVLDFIFYGTPISGKQGLGLLLAGLWVPFRTQGTRVTPVLKTGKSLAVYGAMSAGLFINSGAKTLAAGLLPSAQIYPVLQGANLIASILLGHFLFRERITGKSVAGVACAFLGLMIMRM